MNNLLSMYYTDFGVIWYNDIIFYGKINDSNFETINF
jgi:hypothetical protein